MPLEVAVRSHLRGALASHLEALITENLRALPDVNIVDDAVDYEVFLGGGLIQPEGYRDPNFILLVVATFVATPGLPEQRIPASLPPDDRARLIARLSARFRRYRGVTCRVPALTAEACEDAVKGLDEVHLAGVREGRRA